MQGDHQDWQDGLLTDMQFMGVVSVELGEVQSSLAGLQAQEAVLKSQLGHVVATMQAKQGDSEYRQTKELLARRGYRVSFTTPSVRRSVDYDKLQVVIDALDAAGLDGYARELQLSIRQTPVDGGQRIERIRKDGE